MSGEGATGVWIIARTSKDEEEEQRTFLKRVLSAAQLDLQRDAYTIFKYDDVPLSLRWVRRGRDLKVVLAFGVSAKELGLQLHYRPYEPLSLPGQTYIFADRLSDIQAERAGGNKAKAAALWKVLQTVFLSQKKG